MKVVYDTCLYIDLLRDSSHLDLFRDRGHLRFLSPIVLMELKAGARKPSQKKVVDRLLAPYSRAGRIIHLNARCYDKAGECLARMGERKIELKKGLSHDLLIALSAYSIGATLYTRDKKDFEVIVRYVPVVIRYIY